ncbi:hypothetical protein PI172_2048 [Prevotella intermedia]|uniref:Uncharacterized protein n=1 Tax=Prevotella intermedia TaxID=28131 RepID=A0AAD1BLA6_PREIN|nr:hypothetical protein PIN17_0525 [Prevotella intermedia 17]BAR96776.1 hypothetical protein PI172_2048 [Prevotella intermedia]
MQERRGKAAPKAEERDILTHARLCGNIAILPFRNSETRGFAPCL